MPHISNIVWFLFITFVCLPFAMLALDFIFPPYRKSKPSHFNPVKKYQASNDEILHELNFEEKLL